MANFVTIALFNSQPKAEGARLHLAHHGIRSVLQDENIVAMDWFLSNAVGGIKLQVVEEDVADATSLSSSFVILVMGIVYGVMFCIVRRVWPLVIAHTITNLLIEYNM